jgi:hypothetical protein
MNREARCSHPGCDRLATEIAIVESAWEDTSTGSPLMVCELHAESYARRPPETTQDAMLRAHRRSPDR